MSANRPELVRNAITFLSDPKIQTAPLTQRLAFLESKGMTAGEIEEAIRLSSSGGTGTSGVRETHAPAAPYGGAMGGGVQVVPPVPQRDWRDYFIMAVVSGGLMFGVISLARKYLLPHLQPPSQTVFESTSSELTAQFDAIAASIAAIESSSTAAREAIDAQKDEVDKVSREIEEVVKSVREGEDRNREEWREVREEVQNVKEMLPKMIDRLQSTQSLSLSELQSELKSLKVLLLSRRPDAGGPAGSGSASPSPLPGFMGAGGRPSIPAWQLATPSAAAASSTVETRDGDKVEEGQAVAA